MADRIAAERRCSPPASTPTDRPFVLERRGGDRGALARHVGAHTEDVPALGLGDDGRVDVRVVGGRDRIPGTFEVAVAKLSERQGDSRAMRLDGRGGAAGDDVHVGAVGDQQRQPALRDGAATDDDDLPAGQAQADEVGVLGHPASLEVAAAATKRVTACGCAAGWVCRYDACTPRSTAPSRTLATSRPAIHPRGRIAVGERDCGAVEFVPHGAIADGVQRRVGHRDGLAVAEREAVGEPCRSGQHAAHRMPVEVVDQIGQPGAFGVYRRAAGGQVVDLLAHNVIGRQLGAELLGESAGQHQRGGLRRQRVGQRVELDDLGPGGAQQFARARRSRS